MFSTLARSHGRYALLAAQVLAPAVAVAHGGPISWLAGLGLGTLIGGYAWLANLRHYRAIVDTPTSRVASAAQGFVELAGVARPLPGAGLLSPARQLPCVWYRYRVFESRNGDWQLVDSGESEAEFLLDDGTGVCLLRPYDAEVLSDREDTYLQNGVKHVEETLLAGEAIHALGRFVSLGGAGDGFDERQELHQVLNEWKSDQAELGRRFDVDGNGAIDASEWSLAVDAARAEVGRLRAESEARPRRHALEKPARAGLYVIANHPADALARRYRLWAWGHAGLALVALGAMPYLRP